MRWTVYAVAAIAVLAGVCPPEGGAQDVPAAGGSAGRPAPPEAAVHPREEEPVGGGTLTGIVANDGDKSAIFFFGDDPPDLHYTYFYTINDVENYCLIHERLKLIGSDKTGNYWHYRTLRLDIPFERWPLPKDWYIPKDVLKHPAVWFQTQERNAKFQYYGKAVGYPNVSWPTGKKGEK